MIIGLITIKLKRSREEANEKSTNKRNNRKFNYNPNKPMSYKSAAYKSYYDLLS